MKRWTLAVCVSLLFALEAGASDACIHHCPPYRALDPINNAIADACRLAEAHCELELGSYKLWFAQVSAGVTMEPLPQLYVDLLRSDFPNIDLSEVRWGHSTRQASVAITDCTNIYFFNENFARRLRGGVLTRTDEPLLIHELRHTEQCREVGGRDHYGVMWWRHLDTAMEQNPSPDAIHDLQPMEGDANQHEIDVPAEFPQGLVAISVSALFPDLASPRPVHSRVLWTAAARGARRTREFAFRVERNGAVVAEQPFGTANTFEWWPEDLGDYTITAEARQANSALASATATQSFTVAGAGGNGGNLFSFSCPAGNVLVGVDLRTGIHLDSIAARCMAVKDGRWVRRTGSIPPFEETVTAARGGSGGAPVTLRCPVDSRVIALVGRSGNAIDRLQLECAPLRQTVGQTRPTRTAAAGGSGGAPFRIPCPAGQVAAGLRGRTSTFVNQLDLVCATP